jgi:endoglucanase
MKGLRGLLVVTVIAAAVVVPVTTSGNRSSTTDMRVSSKGKTGVTPPMGVLPVKPTPAPVRAPVPPVVIPPKPAWVNMPLYVDPTNGAATYLAADPTAPGSSIIARLVQMPVANWYGDWNADVRSNVDAYVSAAAIRNEVPVVVAYNIPNRDCGGYSVGGARDVQSYTQWVRQVADGINNRTAVVILEPDALGALDCLPVAQQAERLQALAQAVSILKANSKTAVYIDAGTAAWQPAAVMASRLKQANVAASDGFSLNVSYFAPTLQSRVFGDQLSKLIGYKHYVIDTSRNGGNNNVTGMQCNPSWASFGDTPTTSTGSLLNDALLWIKIPWESDGACNGSPAPGGAYWSYALQLAKNANW